MSIDPFRPTLEIWYVEIYICIFIMTFYGLYLLTILYSIDVGLATWNITSTIQTAIQEVPVAPSLISLIPVTSTPMLHNPKLSVKKSILFILNELQAMFLSETVLPNITNFHIYIYIYTFISYSQYSIMEQNYTHIVNRHVRVYESCHELTKTHV